ncbi:uncharacterized protein LOC111710107 [Eurytemora carolleeae]|uniref:uncharacterized protein LOC111710107 n=1 Tax=Eurytemora carolleeae TaxID=1294199 RepID=UPI000C77833F|nr:uncharacterized protein LOC111710107 [Eurytemora carolleeae]|eukprot:XP_023339905.1 uncharacterized protein LOC111710107 [Eurytemora affinis]
MNHVLLLITLGVVSASWNPAEEGPSTPGGFGLRSARKLNSGFLDLFSSTEIVPRSAKAEVKKKAEDRSFQVGTVTPTPKSFSEIFTPRAPLGNPTNQQTNPKSIIKLKELEVVVLGYL